MQEKNFNEDVSESSKTKKILIAGAVCLVLVSLLCYFIINEKNNSYMNSFVMLKKESGCTFYYNKDSFNTKTPLDISKKIPLDCNKYPFVYITAYEYITSVSFFACQREPDTNEPAHCISWYVPSRQS